MSLVSQMTRTRIKRNRVLMDWKVEEEDRQDWTHLDTHGDMKEKAENGNLDTLMWMGYLKEDVMDAEKKDIRKEIAQRKAKEGRKADKKEIRKEKEKVDTRSDRTLKEVEKETEKLEREEKREAKEEQDRGIIIQLDLDIRVSVSRVTRLDIKQLNAL